MSTYKKHNNGKLLTIQNIINNNIIEKETDDDVKILTCYEISKLAEIKYKDLINLINNNLIIF